MRYTSLKSSIVFWIEYNSNEELMNTKKNILNKKFFILNEMNWKMYEKLMNM